MTSKSTMVAMVAVAIIAIAGMFFPQAPVPVVQVQKDVAGVTNYDDLDVDSVTYGKSCLSLSASTTLTQQNLLDNGCFVTTVAGVQNTLTHTLPATSTLTAFIPNVGECREYWFDNTAVAAATTTTWLLGTGMNLVGLDATGAGTGADVIDGNEYGQMKFCRERDTDITVYMTEWIHAD